MKRFLCKLLVFVLFLCGLFIPASAAGTSYTIKNPYGNVDWSTWQPYRSNLHTHSTVSDANVDFSDIVEFHYEKGYDVLAMTDHGVVDRSWTQPNVVKSLQFIQQITKDGAGLTGLSEARWQAISTGSDRGGQKMLRVPFGIEHNLLPTHLNSWFADWGNGRIGCTFDYVTPVRETDRAGGLCAINHPGAFSTYKVWQIQRLLEKHPALIGLDINSFRDSGTQEARQLWDQLLQNLAPTGRNVFGIATSDAHTLARVGCSWTWHLMPENTAENLRESLETGAFFAASRFVKNADELAIISEKTGLELGGEWECDPNEPEPMVTKITTGQGEISITAQNHALILWISNGIVIATGDSITLSNCEGLGAYVRAEVWGPGGILYTQPFLLHYEGMPAGTPVPWYFVDVGALLPWNLPGSLFFVIKGWFCGLQIR